MRRLGKVAALPFWQSPHFEFTPIPFIFKEGGKLNTRIIEALRRSICSRQNLLLTFRWIGKPQWRKQKIKQMENSYA